MLLRPRRLANPALERLGATLARRRRCAAARGCPRCSGRRADRGRDRDLTIGTFGHAGDGNMHPTIVYRPPATPSPAPAPVRAFDDIIGSALGLGGTVTGEHGVGLLKREWLERELGVASAALHRQIRQAFDPSGVLNPGKVLT